MRTSTPPSCSETPPTAIGQSDAWCQAITLAKKIAPLDMPVLITGESGAGKEVIAQTLHHWSEREKTTFTPLNCSLLQEHLLESELFGHKRGAFTGANQDYDGLFKVASDGTLFLDEIGELSASCQAKLLRVLETGEYRPLGSTGIKHTNARIIAATHRDLEKMIAQGRFRQDLYYRLNVLTIHIPPLNERKEDIPLLVTHFLKQPLGDTAPPSISPGAMEHLMAHHWQGNVRELKNIIERLRIHCDEGIRAADIDLILAQGASTPQRENQPFAQFSHIDSLANMDRHYTQWVLEQLNGNVSQAAKALKISRTTLYRILNTSR